MGKVGCSLAIESDILCARDFYSVFRRFSEDIVGLGALFARNFFERVIAGETGIFTSNWVLDSTFESVFARNFFGKLHAKWSVEVSISGDGAGAALKNCSAQDLFGRKLDARKRTFASGRLLGIE